MNSLLGLTQPIDTVQIDNAQRLLAVNEHDQDFLRGAYSELIVESGVCRYTGHILQARALNELAGVALDLFLE